MYYVRVYFHFQILNYLVMWYFDICMQRKSHSIALIHDRYLGCLIIDNNTTNLIMGSDNV